jgi:hypothetical protein
VTRLDPVAQRALGVLASVDDVDAAAVPALLDRLADESVAMPAELLVRVISRVALLAARGLEIDRPDRVRVVDGSGSRVVAADQAVVLEAPMYRQRPDLGLALPVPPACATALADLLDLPLAGELAVGEVSEDGPDAGTIQSTPGELRRLISRVPAAWCEHDRLIVDGVEVDWWVSGTGPDASVHAATTDGLARALAWAAGGWELRALVAQLLAEPATAADVMIDQVFGVQAVAGPSRGEPGAR